MSENTERYVVDPSCFNGTCVTSMRDGIRSDYFPHRTLRELRIENDNSNLISITPKRMNFLMRRYIKTLQLPFKEITEERFDDYMNCVPPKRFTRNSFFVGECCYADLYTFCFKLDDKYYCGLRSIKTSDNDLLRQIRDFDKHISFKAKLIKGDRIYGNQSHSHIKGFSAPYVFDGRDSCSHLIWNLFSETGNLLSDKMSRFNMARKLLNLRGHNYEYITILSEYDSIFDLFEHIQKSNDTIEIENTLFRISSNRDYVDFVGVIKSYSTIKRPICFHYRIYDREIFQHIINLLRTVKRGPSTIEYHRDPTPLELKLGYGAIHYLTVETEKVRKKDGSLKRWFIHTDGLRYYYNP